MTTESPMTPADCDLRGLEWMPLYGGRLFGSDFDAHATDAEWRAAMQLWWAAWNQVPAASLPDDDVALCRLAGFGRDVKAWAKVKKRALYGFTICTDGRLYHKALSAFAIESWARRLKDRERKAKYRAEKERKSGDGTRTGTGTGRGQGMGQNGPVPADEMRRDETGCDETLSKKDSAAEREVADLAFAEFQETSKRNGWPQVDFLNSSRRWALDQRLAECGGIDGWRALIAKAEGAAFLAGKGWFDLDWLLDQSNFTRCMEGRFDELRTRNGPKKSGDMAAFARAGVLLKDKVYEGL